MGRQVILLSNTFPLKGEPFLQTELDLLPNSFKIDQWPFFSDGNRENAASLKPGIETHLLSSNYSIKEKLDAMLHSFGTFLSTGEIVAAFKKPNGFHNVAKALKYGMISELRVRRIKHKLLTDEPLLFYSYWMYEVAYVAAKLKKWHSNSKFVTRCHGYDLYGERHANGYLPFRQFIMDQADLICPISESGKSYLHDSFAGKYDEKISVMRLGTIRKAEIPEKQEKEESIVLVSCSNLVDVKRVHLIIDALKKCQKQVIWYHFGDGELKASLEKQAEVLPENVRYMFMGYQPNEDVQTFYANHYIDAFVNVSQSEGVPVSIMEAESYGIPIIATDVGGTSEIVYNRENGVLLNVEFSDEELLMAIDEVVEKAESYRAASLRTWQTMSDAHLVFPEFYKKLAEV